MYVNVKDFGSSGTGVSDSTPAIQAAINSIQNGTIYIPEGEYVVSTIALPKGKHINIVGSGLGSTILLQRENGSSILQMEGIGTTIGAVDRAVYRDFSVKASSGSDKTNLQNPAIRCSGMRSCRFENIGYLANGEGSFGVMFDLSSNVANQFNPCYGNTFQGIHVSEQFGPSRVFYTHNGGSGPSGNPNAIEIRDCWFCGNNEIDVIIDGLASAKANVRNCLFEQNATAICIIPGTQWLIDGNWFESNKTSIYGQNDLLRGTTNQLTVIANYFSSQEQFFFPEGSIMNLFINNSEPAGITLVGPGKASKLNGPG